MTNALISKKNGSFLRKRLRKDNVFYCGKQNLNLYIYNFFSIVLLFLSIRKEQKLPIERKITNHLLDNDCTLMLSDEKNLSISRILRSFLKRRLRSFLIYRTYVTEYILHYSAILWIENLQLDWVVKDIQQKINYFKNKIGNLW